jgi:4-carboxymuconolactone decarboxylase
MDIQDLCAGSVALAKYEGQALFGRAWQRPGLSQRDRSMVTLAAIISQGSTDALSLYANFSLDNDVAPIEISEIATHLAFYAGWCKGTLAAIEIGKVFRARGIDSDQLADANAAPLPLDEAAEAQRKAFVEENFGTVAPGVLELTTDVIFRDLWLRPGLAPRDRSLVTVSALVANGQVAQIPYHLNRAMDNGLTATEASEALTQLAFYAGWPNVFSAMPVFKEVLARRTA